MQRINTLTSFVLTLLLTGTAFSQEYRIRNFGVRQGISHPFVYTINQDSRGYIWIGTGEGLCRFNGFEFNTDIKQDSLGREVAGISYKDSTGSLWFGYYSGNIARYQNGRFETLNTGIEIGSSITGFSEYDRDNLVISTLNRGLIIVNRVSGKGVRLSGIEGAMCTAFYIKKNYILLGTTDGLSIYNLDRHGNKAGLQFNIRELEYLRIQDIKESLDRNAFWIATEDQGIYRLTLKADQYSITKTGAGLGIDHEKVQSVFEDSENNLWVSTLMNGAFRWSQADGKGDFGLVTHYSKENGLPGNSIKKVFEDLEGNIWIATYGEGISLLTLQAFSFHEYNSSGLENDIQSVAFTNGDDLYLGGRKVCSESKKEGINLQ